MSRVAAIGIQDFSELIRNKYFYVDKTDFIREWWSYGDKVTLITRPRRFGKTLAMSMVECFFSNRFSNTKALFNHLAISDIEEMSALQGTYPVINLSFANMKENSYEMIVYRICQIISELYEQFWEIIPKDVLTEVEKTLFSDAIRKVEPRDAAISIHRLSTVLYRVYGKKVIILLDEYDTPMQEAYVHGFWVELAGFMRSFFNATFKTNPCLERALLTGITRISRESIFSDLNNLEIITTTSEKYSASFGFTEAEVFAALEEFGDHNQDEIKTWYDGFSFGSIRDIYNPWSILNYLAKGKVDTYWANTSRHDLINLLIRSGDRELKSQFEALLQGDTVFVTIDEEVAFDQLADDNTAIWSLLLASGYLRVIKSGEYQQIQADHWKKTEYELAITNLEVRLMFERMISGWFRKSGSGYNDFVSSLLAGNLKEMNAYMNQIARTMFSYYDTGKNASDKTEPERFYHGFVLGLIVDLRDRFIIRSNRESGFGRYDITMEPIDKKNEDAIILEFKVFNKEEEKSLNDTVLAAREQIEKKQYKEDLMDRGVPEKQIRVYGIAFSGKQVLIG